LPESGQSKIKNQKSKIILWSPGNQKSKINVWIPGNQKSAIKNRQSQTALA
jgi:hypothetical protein